MLNIPFTTQTGMVCENTPGPFLLTAATLNSSALPNENQRL